MCDAFSKSSSIHRAASGLECFARKRFLEPLKFKDVTGIQVRCIRLPSFQRHTC